MKTKLNLSANMLKILAITTMFFDHFVAALLPHNEMLTLYLRIPGRIAAPIMCFIVAEGYHHTSNRMKYIKRLLLFALISHLPYNTLFNYGLFKATSMMWGLALGLIALAALKDQRLHPLIKITVLIFACFLAIPANWNFIGVLWVVAFGFFQGDFKKQAISFILIGVICHLVPNYIRFGLYHQPTPHWYQLGIFLALPLLAAYNGQRGRVSKTTAWFFYGFYPGHLIFIYLLKIYTPLSTIFRRLI